MHVDRYSDFYYSLLNYYQSAQPKYYALGRGIKNN